MSKEGNVLMKCKGDAKFDRGMNENDPEYTRSNSTVDGLNHAANKLELILDYYDIPSPLKRNSVNEKLFHKAAHFLANVYTGTSKKKKLSCGSILQYLSGVYNVVKSRFPSHPIFKEKLALNRRLGEFIPEWYSDLREDVYRDVIHQIQQEGGKLQNKSLPIGRKVATTIGKSLLRFRTSELHTLIIFFAVMTITCGKVLKE